ncbi:MAG: DUF1189 family protein [Nitrospirota bacterium]
MRQYGMFHAPFMSFFSQSFYRDVDTHWKGTGFAYLLLLLTICWIPGIIQLHHSVGDYVENGAPALIEQLPTITIIKGEASVAVAQPYKITDPDSKMVIALIDTTGKTVSLEGSEARVLLTRAEVIYKKSAIETRNFSLKEINAFVLDQEKVTGWLAIVRKYVAVVAFPFAVVGSFAFRVAQVLIYAAIGILFARMCKTDRPYQTLLRLSVMAVTPVIIVSTVFGMIGIKIPFHVLVYFLAAMAYLYFAVYAASHQDVGQEKHSMSI